MNLPTEGKEKKVIKRRHFVLVQTSYIMIFNAKRFGWDELYIIICLINLSKTLYSTPY